MNKETQVVNNQDVSEALNLLKETLEEEKTRLFKFGSLAMGEQDVQTVQAVVNFAKKLEIFTEEFQNLNNKWLELLKEREAASPAVQEIVTGDGKLFGMRIRKTTGGFTRNVTHPLAHKTNFYVQFTDGTIIKTPKAADTFALSIDKLGAERVSALSLLMGGEPLVARQVSQKYPVTSKEISNGFFVKTHSNTETKMKYLEKIAKLLNVKLKIVLMKN